MEKDRIYFEGLIARYFSKEATPAEIGELSSWVNENPENAAVFGESRYAWMAFEEVRITGLADVDEAWEAFKDKVGIREETRSAIGSQQSKRAIPMYRILLRIAAVIVILAFPAFHLYKYLQQPAIKEFAAGTGRAETLLPDGSHVMLNSGAVIKYPEKFKGKKRAVSLDGEAYFDVAHNASKPFIIATDGIRVEVKGTSFYINTRSWSGDFELVLTSGKVELYFENQPGQSRVLNPGEKAIVHGNQIIISPNTDANYMAWKTHKISFNNEPLNSVAATLSKVYQANVRLGNSSLASCRLTATFDNQSLESVLNVLKATLDVDIRNSGSLVEISGKGCR
ncbi:MAG: FecR domain-containing protein [Bacteroidota bacterium]|jgi:transmembrane sensor